MGLGDEKTSVGMYVWRVKGAHVDGTRAIS